MAKGTILYNGVEYQIVKAVEHPKYKQNNLLDAAILVLAKNIPNAHVVRLNLQHKCHHGERLTAFGWGVVQSRQVASVLQEAKLTINSGCEAGSIRWITRDSGKAICGVCIFAEHFSVAI